VHASAYDDYAPYHSAPAPPPYQAALGPEDYPAEADDYGYDDYPAAASHDHDYPASQDYGYSAGGADDYSAAHEYEEAPAYGATRSRRSRSRDHVHDHGHGYSHGHAHGYGHGHTHGHAHGHAHGHSHGHARSYAHDGRGRARSAATASHHPHTAAHGGWEAADEAAWGGGAPVPAARSDYVEVKAISARLDADARVEVDMWAAALDAIRGRGAAARMLAAAVEGATTPATAAAIRGHIASAQSAPYAMAHARAAAAARRGTATATAAAAPAGTSAARYALMRFDGACRGNPGRGGAAAVLWDRGGGVELAYHAQAMPTTTNNRAEDTGLLIGLHPAAAVRVTHLVVEGDSELVIKQVRGEYAVRDAELAKLHSNVLAARAPFSAIEFRYIPRAANGRADAVSNLAADGANSVVLHEPQLAAHGFPTRLA